MAVTVRGTGASVYNSVQGSESFVHSSTMFVQEPYNYGTTFSKKDDSASKMLIFTILELVSDISELFFFGCTHCENLGNVVK